MYCEERHFKRIKNQNNCAPKIRIEFLKQYSGKRNMFFLQNFQKQKPFTILGLLSKLYPIWITI